MPSDAKKLKHSKPNQKARKGHGMATPKPHAKWTEFVEKVRKELGWSLEQMYDLTGMTEGWVKKARRGGEVTGDLREKFQNAINGCWEEKFPSKPKLDWPDWVDGAPWAAPASNVAASSDTEVQKPPPPSEGKIPPPIKKLFAEAEKLLEKSRLSDVLHEPDHLNERHLSQARLKCEAALKLAAEQDLLRAPTLKQLSVW
jgi:hypothetical protein